MTKTNQTHAPVESMIPYGADPRRSKVSLVILGVLYFAWFLVLCWLAAYHIGR